MSEYGYNNQYSTSYGANRAADGGGFVAGEPQSSPAAGRGGFGKETIRPVTIKQIKDAQQPHPDADFTVDGEALGQVTFVGQIRSINTQPTNITYTIDDGTGIAEVKQWIDSDAAMNMNADKMDGIESGKPRLVEDAYCRVWGRLKAFHNKRHIGAHIIRPITDYNEINYHLLEATAVHLFFTRGPPQQNGQKGVVGGTNGAAGVTHQEFASATDSALPNVSPLARRVYNTLKNTAQSNEGLHVQMLASQMGMNVNDVYKGAEELLAIGVIFTTVDDNTWAPLEV
ncbi:replication factor A2 [Exophiala dermatitidis NIH/UT8656]|uniref:Replication factor A2 n=1 Tax=Exophiala dermatitidis (strain ATCC 34100 / CBS 525.76 / NIH/UT8656) TaxID=858893 RepID=H6BLC9_EXODN|nr:replication factor A2 [Exophiala dermatitidis NIH/UT8656]EHY52822.1 replication factor A2 [Exophiala dermatitidis NIH/UT8656]KAJ4609415.1 Replication factor A protein 2 [Exophiala dermatitidis]